MRLLRSKDLEFSYFWGTRSYFVPLLILRNAFLLRSFLSERSLRSFFILFSFLFHFCTMSIKFNLSFYEKMYDLEKFCDGFKTKFPVWIWESAKEWELNRNELFHFRIVPFPFIYIFWENRSFLKKMILFLLRSSNSLQLILNVNCIWKYILFFVLRPRMFSQIQRCIY